MKTFYSKVPRIFKSFYFLVGAFFLIWMLFFDSNDIITHLKLSSKRDELRSAKEFYENKIVEVKNDREALLNNDELLEKLAREKFLMKKEEEDIFIIEE